MKKTYVIVSAIALSFALLFVITSFKTTETARPDLGIYEYSFNTPKGELIKMDAFRGKTILIVNTATQCGLTPQFAGLEKLHKKYKDKGLVVIGFPCNQFRNQSPESNETVEAVCLKEHGVTFQLTEKIDVNGENAHPLYVYLKNQLRGKLGKDIKWNFTKFLISSSGKPLKRFSPKTKPESFEDDIIAALEKK